MFLAKPQKHDNNKKLFLKHLQRIQIVVIFCSNSIVKQKENMKLLTFQLDLNL